MKKRILIDFDGVIHSYKSGWKGARNIPDEPVPGAIAWLYDLAAQDDLEVCIYSARSGKWGGRRAMKKWVWKWACKHFGLPDDGDDLDHSLPAFAPPLFMMEKLKFPRKKGAAWVTIDDRCIPYKGGDHPKIYEIKDFKSWVGFG